MMLILMLIMMVKICVKESSNVIDLENFGMAGFFITAWLGQCSPYQSNLPRPPTPPNFYIHQVFTLLLLEVGIKRKNCYKNFQQQNKSIFLGNLYKIFCLRCTFLEELVIHDHDGLLRAEKFQYPTKIFGNPYCNFFSLLKPTYMYKL